jgi:PAS domain S-box-containing protein/putative nucleotidyltransferase with HDIG domain
MAADMHRSSARVVSRTLRAFTRLRTLALILTLFGGVFSLRVAHSNAADADEIIYVLPIAVAALRFGLRGGLAAAVLAIALVLAWDLPRSGGTLGASGYISRGAAFFVLGLLLGLFVDQRQRLERRLTHYFDSSLDLLATASTDGYLIRVNPAWERVLGHSSETLCSRPFIEFVHPDDRAATEAEDAALADRSRDTIGFRNRYQAADGTYRWLEWSGSNSDEMIHAVARDVTVQVAAEDQVANNAEMLQAKVEERTWELREARAEILKRLAFAAEYRDDDTFHHTERVGEMAAGIARELGLPAAEVTLIQEAAPLHDIGKLAISDTILLKPGALTAEERATMQTHTTAGAAILHGSSSPVLQMAGKIAAAHHERWDGTGYPAGLAGQEIPLVARIVAVADVCDALTHERPYKNAWTIEEALAEIERSAGTQFDPDVARAFLAIQRPAAVRARASANTRPATRRIGHGVRA